MTLPSNPVDAPRPVLTPDQLAADPFDQFREWLLEAERHSGMKDPNAMCLATIGEDGLPQARIVLLKGIDARGFVFYTNLESAKGRALAANPQAALTFHWDRLGRQVRVQGAVEQVAHEEADAYYASRPRGSRIGAWASQQSTPLADRAELEARIRDVEARFATGDIPRPPHWSGFRVIPRAIEFWQERASRLHDRFVYRPVGGGRWETERLNP